MEPTIENFLAFERKYQCNKIEIEGLHAWALYRYEIHNAIKKAVYKTEGPGGEESYTKKELIKMALNALRPFRYHNVDVLFVGNGRRTKNVDTGYFEDIYCDDIAKIVKEKNIRKTDFTYDTVYNAFGREVADAVFPQVKGKKIHEPDEFLILNISRLLEIDGYFTLKTLKRFYRDNLWKFNETVFCHQIPMIMERLRLEKLSANNKIKEQYGITDKGYPRIFVKKGH